MHPSCSKYTGMNAVFDLPPEKPIPVDCQHAPINPKRLVSGFLGAMGSVAIGSVALTYFESSAWWWRAGPWNGIHRRWKPLFFLFKTRIRARRDFPISPVSWMMSRLVMKIAAGWFVMTPARLMKVLSEGVFTCRPDGKCWEYLPRWNRHERLIGVS